MEPTTKGEVAVLAIARSSTGAGATGVGSDAVLLPGTTSFGVATVATFVTDGTAALPTETVSVIGGAAAPGARITGLPQVTAAPTAEQVHPVPVAET